MVCELVQLLPSEKRPFIPAKPLYKIHVISQQAGEEWMARLGAIFNG